MLLIFLILIVSLFKLSACDSVQVDCGIKNDRKHRKSLLDESVFFTLYGQICGFKVDRSKNSSEINFNVPVDDKTEHLAFIYTTTSIPILPAELFRKFPNKTLNCGFFNLASIKIERDWFKHAGNLKHLFFLRNRIPKLEGGKFVDLKKLVTLNLQRNSISNRCWSIQRAAWFESIEIKS
jgi:hypothetical protein